MIRRPPSAGVGGLLRLVCAGVLSVVAASTVITLEARRAPALPCGLDLKLLVLAADGNEPVLKAITQTLDYQGTPYELHVAAHEPGAVTADFLNSGCRGFYQGIIQTSASLVYYDGANYVSALSPAESEALIAYETQFDVRHINLYSFPTPDLGLFFTSAVGTTGDAPLPVVFTPAGQTLFPYLSVVTAPERNRLSALFPSVPAGLGITWSWT